MSAQVVDQLFKCLEMLDELGERIAASHVDAAIQALLASSAAAAGQGINTDS